MMEDRQVLLKQVLDTVDEMPVMKDNNGMEFIEKSLAKTRVRMLPSAQPEQSTEVQDILQYLDEYLHPIVSPEHWSVYSELYDMVSMLPSAQPEIKPIDYQDCANAMLRMWMDKVVTDGEYNRIMDKLNAFWRTKNE